MKEYKEVFDDPKEVFDDPEDNSGDQDMGFSKKLNNLARQNWRVVPGCFQIIHEKDGNILSFVLMERDKPVKTRAER